MLSQGGWLWSGGEGRCRLLGVEGGKTVHRMYDLRGESNFKIKQKTKQPH